MRGALPGLGLPFWGGGGGCAMADTGAFVRLQEDMEQ